MTMLRKALHKKKKRKGAAMVEYAVLIGAVTLIGILGLSVLGSKVSDIISTLAVILPGSQTADDLKLHRAQLIEFTGGDDGTFQIDSSRIGGGDTNRIGRNTGLESSAQDSVFVVREGD